ncbi:MAG: Fic family protein, partial [Byssovorax sp.]
MSDPKLRRQMDLGPMAAKKTRKLSKKSGKKVQKPARRPGGSRASAKKSAPARAKLQARKIAAKSVARKRTVAKKAAPTRRPAPSKRAALPKLKKGKALKKVVRAKLKVKLKLSPAKKAAAAKLAKKAAPARLKLAKKKLAPAKAAPLKASLAKAPSKVAPPAKKSAPSLRELRSSEPVSRSGSPSRSGRERPSVPAPSHAGKRGSEPPSSKSVKGGKAGKAGGRERGRERLVREPPSRLITMPLPMIQPPKRLTVEERSVTIDARLAAQTDEFRRRYIDSFDMSWIYHDSALEGVVYTFDELRTALAGQTAPVADSSLQPTYDDIRRHKEAIEFVRDFAMKKKLPVTLDVVKKIYLILHPAEGDIKTVKYRKDIPQHRLYFHEYAAPDKIAHKVRQIIDWLNDPETRKTRNGVRIAARAHYDLLRVYPFPVDSGKAARLFMNLLLMRSGLPPAILHSTERQRYYEALKGSATTVLQMVQEAVENALSSVEKLLDE